MLTVFFSLLRTLTSGFESYLQKESNLSARNTMVFPLPPPPCWLLQKAKIHSDFFMKPNWSRSMMLVQINLLGIKKNPTDTLDDLFLFVYSMKHAQIAWKFGMGQLTNRETYLPPRPPKRCLFNNVGYNGDWDPHKWRLTHHSSLQISLEARRDWDFQLKKPYCRFKFYISVTPGLSTGRFLVHLCHHWPAEVREPSHIQPHPTTT